LREIFHPQDAQGRKRALLRKRRPHHAGHRQAQEHNQRLKVATAGFFHAGGQGAQVTARGGSMTENQNSGGNAKSMSIIVTKGSLDWAYPPFILATTAAAMGVDVTLFFTFYGLELLKKKLDLQVTALGNAAMKMPVMGMHIGMPNVM